MLKMLKHAETELDLALQNRHSLRGRRRDSAHKGSSTRSAASKPVLSLHACLTLESAPIRARVGKVSLGLSRSPEIIFTVTATRSKACSATTPKKRGGLSSVAPTARKKATRRVGPSPGSPVTVPTARLLKGCESVEGVMVDKAMAPEA